VFEITAPIQSPGKCEARSVIWIPNAKSERPAGIQKQIAAVYGDVMNRQNVKWCREFSGGRTDIHTPTKQQQAIFDLTTCFRQLKFAQIDVGR
jgi:hypothetical protein